MKQTLKEINFIMYERPQQRDVAGEVLQELYLSDLEGRESLRTIAGASQQLLEILPQEMRLINTQWAMPFLRLEDASQDATRYYSPLDWQAKSNALENLLVNLDKVHPNMAFSDTSICLQFLFFPGGWSGATRGNVASEPGRTFSSQVETTGSSVYSYLSISKTPLACCSHPVY